MNELLELLRGPIFRLTFSIMILGLVRILILDIWGMIEAYRKAGDKDIPWKLTISRTLEWFFPYRRVIHHRPFYSVCSICFHIGLLIVPLFLFAHIRLWEKGLGISWPALPIQLADSLTLATIAFASALFLGRIGNSRTRAISRKQDYLWPLILAVPFVTGYICSSAEVSPSVYQALMLVHILSGEIIFLFLPFTKIAHCILMPLSQLVITLAWKFPARVDEDICETLGKKGAGV